MKNKAFTLIELLAVIIILGILMLIAIPSVSNYINSARKNTYVTTIDQILKGAVAEVTGNKIDVSNKNKTYYIPYTCIDYENGLPKSPYGELEEAYVVVRYNGAKFEYYYIGKDKANYGVGVLTSYKDINVDSIKSNINSIDTSIGIDGTTSIAMYNSDCTQLTDDIPITSTIPGINEEQEQEDKAICKRATTLHTALCTDLPAESTAGGHTGCYELGFYEGGSKGTSTITYGTLKSIGESLEPGDVFDCDVNNDGTYDEETERFYYLTNDEDKSILLYYANVDISGNKLNYPSHKNFPYDENNVSLNGPITAYAQLPNKTQWKNPKIIAPGIRQLKSDDNKTNSNGIEFGLFDYGNKAARLPTIQDIENACSVTIKYDGKLHYGQLNNCYWMFENTNNFNDLEVYSDDDAIEKWKAGIITSGYWLENPTYVLDYYGNPKASAWMVESMFRLVGTQLPNRAKAVSSDSNICGVRPVITVLTSDIEY